MIRKIIILICFFCFANTINAQKKKLEKSIITAEKSIVIKDTVTIAIVDTIKKDTITIWKLFKENARASYYANKFNGRRTASGKKFDMNKLSVAHKNLPFGTMLRITNPINGKFVIAEVIDRGPFVRSREIDLSKKAFMDIADNKNSGLITVKIEITDKLNVPIDNNQQP